MDEEIKRGRLAAGRAGFQSEVSAVGGGREIETTNGRKIMKLPRTVVPGLVTLVLAVHVQNADAVYVNGQPLMLVDPYGLAPGDKFKSADDAALDAGNWARKFKMQRIEYGGWIYKEEKCYVYDASGVGGGASAKLNAKPANAVAAWHTHSSRAPFFEDSDEE